MFALLSQTNWVNIFGMYRLVKPTQANNSNKPPLNIADNLVSNRSNGHPASTKTLNIVNSRSLPWFHSPLCRFSTHRTLVCLGMCCIHCNLIRNLSTVTGRDKMLTSKLFTCTGHTHSDSQLSIVCTALGHCTPHSWLRIVYTRQRLHNSLDRSRTSKTSLIETDTHTVSRHYHCRRTHSEVSMIHKTP